MASNARIAFVCEHHPTIPAAAHGVRGRSGRIAGISERDGPWWFPEVKDMIIDADRAGSSGPIDVPQQPANHANGAAQA